MIKLVDRLHKLIENLEKLDEEIFEKVKMKATLGGYIASIRERRKLIEEIRKTLIIINDLKTQIEDEKDILDLLNKIQDEFKELGDDS